MQKGVNFDTIYGIWSNPRTLIMRDDNFTDLDLIMDEIEAASNQDEKEVPSPTEEEASLVKKTGDDIDDRRKRAWALRQRGKTYREIGAELDVSVATVKRDLDIARRTEREAIEFHDREDYLASLMAQYEDVKREAWNIIDGADKETRLKALTTIRQTLDAQRKALQDTGVVKKENQVQEIVHMGLVAKWDEQDVGRAAAALVASQLNLHLEAPSLDEEGVEYAEVIEEETNGEEENE